jgi:hypothetical protein
MIPHPPSQLLSTHRSVTTPRNDRIWQPQDPRGAQKAPRRLGEVSRIHRLNDAGQQRSGDQRSKYRIPPRVGVPRDETFFQALLVNRQASKARSRTRQQVVPGESEGRTSTARTSLGLRGIHQLEEEFIAYANDALGDIAGCIFVPALSRYRAVRVRSRLPSSVPSSLVDV